MNSVFSSNPIDTPEQRAVEQRALELFAHPDFRAAQQAVTEFWLNEVNPGDDARSCFERAFEEVSFGAIVWSLNQDPLNPQVITISRVAHELAGQRVPGSRWGIDNPDSVYRVIPISGEQKYRIHGRVGEQRLTENYFTLWDEHMGTVDVLSGKDLVLDNDGRFTITVDHEPAAGRSNHIQSSNAARQFYIRDVLQDWSREQINELSIERLGEPAIGLDPEGDLQRAIDMLWMNARNTARWNRQATDKPANAFEFKIDRDVDGALRNQIYLLGEFKLQRGQAMIIDIDLGGAEYFIAPITNLWGTTNEIVKQTGSLNLSQLERICESRLQLVLSVSDPGVYNWLDPDGLHEGILTLRWAEFANGRPEDTLSATARLVDLKSLQHELAPETGWVDATARASQLQQRAASYAWRLLEREV